MLHQVHLTEEKKIQNSVFSPLSLNLLIDVLSQYITSKTTKTELRTFLKQQNFRLKELEQLILLLENTTTNVKVASSIWHSPKLISKKYNHPFLKDFSKPKNLQRAVDKWIRKNTNNLIQTVEFNENADVLMFSSLYFKGLWVNEFQTPYRSEAFHLSPNATKQVGYLSKYSQEPITYYQADSFDMIGLPYQDDRLQFEIYLPKAVDGLKDLLKELNWTFLLNLNQAFKTQSSYFIRFPKFEIETDLFLNPLFKQTGLSTIFEEQDLDIFEETPFFLSNISIRQKTVFKVHERGTEAASITYSMLYGSTFEPSLEFHAKHPFFFLIRDRVNNQILFTGTVEKPMDFVKPKPEPRQNKFKRILNKILNTIID